LARTAVTPNQVSAASVVASAAAAACYVCLAWPFNAAAGLGLQILWHVLDGADGDLARRTGRASPIGELVDGVCDHVSQALLYIAFALMAARSIGAWAWPLAIAAALSHFVQANAYETGRKSYRHHVYGAPWMRQTGAGVGGAGGSFARIYMSLSERLNVGGAVVAAALGRASAEAGRRAYREAFAPVLKRSGLLASNTRTLAGFAAVLIARPAWFFVFEIIILNGVLAALLAMRLRASARLATRLGAY
jgi:phosphatidylglycerophosphate synthase